MADEQRSRLHEIVDRLPTHELALAAQLLELLATGRVSPGGPTPAHPGQTGNPAEPAGPPGTDEDPESSSLSPDVAAKLAELTDDELLRLDELLARDRDAARQFWRERFGEELADDDLGSDGIA